MQGLVKGNCVWGMKGGGGGRGGGMGACMLECGKGRNFEFREAVTFNIIEWLLIAHSA